MLLSTFVTQKLALTITWKMPCSWSKWLPHSERVELLSRRKSEHFIFNLDKFLILSKSLKHRCHGFDSRARHLWQATFGARAALVALLSPVCCLSSTLSLTRFNRKALFQTHNYWLFKFTLYQNSSSPANAENPVTLHTAGTSHFLHTNTFASSLLLKPSNFRSKKLGPTENLVLKKVPKKIRMCKITFKSVNLPKGISLHSLPLFNVNLLLS